MAAANHGDLTVEPVADDLAQLQQPSIAYDTTTIPGSSATLTICSSARSAAGSGINARVANTTPGTRIRPYRRITSRYSDSATISTSVTSSRERRQV